MMRICCGRKRYIVTEKRDGIGMVGGDGVYTSFCTQLIKLFTAGLNIENQWKELWTTEGEKVILVGRRVILIGRK